MTLHSFYLAPPDAELPCCMASALDGDHCTCWTDLLSASRPKLEPLPGPSKIRRRMCEDCAYRPTSPERAELDGDPLSYNKDEVFYCHDGMPFVIAHVHPDGTVRAAEPGAYDPHLRGAQAWQADGTPALVCAGWAAANRMPR